MVVADLHVHTTRSDGSLAPSAVERAAEEVGLTAVAITDHDRLPPGELTGSTQSGIEIIGGIELRVTTGEQRLDLLGYGIDPTPALRAEIERLQTDRIKRARAIVSQVEDRTDVDLDVTLDRGVGRPHVARAIAESDAPYDYMGAFEHLIGDGGPCYVAREITPYERGRELLTEAASVVSLAHPLRYDDPDAALSRASELDAVELAYPYDGSVDLAPVEATIAQHDLLATGGSDAHEDRVGNAGLDRPAYDRLRARLSG